MENIHPYQTEVIIITPPPRRLGQYHPCTVSPQGG